MLGAMFTDHPSPGRRGADGPGEFILGPALARTLGRILRSLSAAMILALLSASPARAQTQGERAQVVVELYTSQGCTQCPRANRLLGRFEREPGVLALTFPVGIWDYLGWRDTFARPEFSERQRAYSRTLRVRGRFTPQLIINGGRQISASDWDEARTAYDAARAAGWPAGAPMLSISRLRNNRVRVTLDSGARSTPADIWLLSYEPGPITVVITGGANIDRSMAHYNLVLRIERLGAWEGASVWYERPRCDPECAVVVQEPNGGPILAAAFTSHTRRH